MSKDYAKRNVNRHSKHGRGYAQKQSHPVLWLTTGLSIGLLMAGLIYLKQGQGITLPHFKSSSPIMEGEAKNKAKIQHKKPTQVAVKPKFDFYTLLPEDQVEIEEAHTEHHKQVNIATLPSPQAEIPVIDRSPLRSAITTTTGLISEEEPKSLISSQTTEKSLFFVQAGTFSVFEDADNLKARIALMGHHSEIRVAQSGGTKLYRVVLGPFGNRTTAGVKQQNLAANQINSFILTE